MENEDENNNTIKVGNYIVVQRQGYTKLHKLKEHSTLILGFHIEMDNVIGENYYDTFQLKNTPGNRKFYTLEKVEHTSIAREGVTIEQSGADNRHILNNSESQSLTKEDMDKLKDAELNSNNIVEHVITNSKTFNMKTGYSQEKYTKKKEKKYFEYIKIKRPSIRILVQMFYRQNPTKTLGIRIDDLSQILTYANIHPEGNHLLYDSGTYGMMPAAITSAIGPATKGQLIHMHPGNECQKIAFIAMQFPVEQAQRCINVNLYSVLRCFYQNRDCNDESDEETSTAHVLTEENTVAIDKTTTVSESEIKQSDDSDEPSAKKPKLKETQSKKFWQLDNEKACRILQNKVDTLIITSREHPVNIAKELLPFLNGNRSFVVFSLFKEPLQDLYFYLIRRLDIINIRLLNTFMRNYQVLPERTHPEVNMNTGGYILTGLKLKF